MNTCDTCKWWIHHGYVSLIGNNHRVCENPKIQESNTGDDEMGYPYDEGGYMSTGPNFGCIHHEPK